MTKIYETKKGNKVVALDNVNLAFDNKGLTFILGASGSGKSTLLNLIGGLDKADKGNIIVKGNHTNEFNKDDFDYYRNSIIGFVFQEFNLIDNITVKENIALALEFQGKDNIDIKVKEALKLVHLEGYEDRYPNELSGGQKQRIAIARAYIKNPEIILADEPTGFLDSDTGKEIFNLLKLLANERLVIVVSHDQKQAEQYADRIIELKDGKVTGDTVNEEVKLGNSKQDYYTKQKLRNKRKINKLYFKSSLRLALIFLNYRKIRFFITILISIIAFSLFALSFSMFTYDKNKAGLASIIDNNVNYINITRKAKGDAYIGSIQKLGDEHLEKLNQDCQSLNFKPVYSPMSTGNLISYSNIIADIGSLYNEYIHNPFLSGFYELDIDEMHSMKMNLVSGRLPKKDNEIALSKHSYEVFEKFRYVDVDYKIIDINSYEDLINKTFRFTVNGVDELFVIVGIVDTKLNYSKYKDILTVDELTKQKEDAKAELQDLLYNGFHNLGFVNSGYIKRNAMNVYSPSGDSRIDSYLDELGNERNINSYHLLKNNNDLNIIMFRDNKLDEIKINEVIISDRIFINSILTKEELFREKSGIEYLMSLDQKLLKELLILNQIYYNFNDDWTEEGRLEYATEAYNIIYKPTDSHLSFVYPAGVKTKNEFNAEFLKEILINYSSIEININSELNYEIDNNDALKKNYTFIIVGIAMPIDFPESGKLYLTKDTFISNNIFDLGVYNSALAYTDFQNKTDILNLVKMNFDRSEDEYFIYNNFVMGKLRNIDFTIRDISKTFLYIALFFMLIAIILLSNFISTIVNDRIVEIGILRALGARTKDVSKIFVFQSMIVGLINFVFASILTFIGMIVINNILKTDFNIILTILTFSFLEPILLLTITLLVSILSSIIPVYRFSNKQPIDVIKVV